MPRAPIDRDLTLEIDELLRAPPPVAPARSQAAAAIGVGVDRHLPLAVVAERGRLQHRRAADLANAVGRSSSLVTAANGATGRPRAARNVFSRIRCCAMASAPPLGRTRRQRLGRGGRGGRTRSRTRTSRRRRARANSRTRSRSSYDASTSTSAICPVGVSCSGASVWTR